MILLVDDDLATRNLIAHVLTDEGIDCLTAAHGAEALQLLQTASSRRPDLILLDLHMDTMNGRQFVAAYRQRPPPHAPILLLSGASEVVDVVEEVGANGFLQKPFNLDQMLTFVRRYLSPSPPSPPASPDPHARHA